MARVLTWNGTDLPPELRGLPAGRYVVEELGEEPELTAEEEAGIEAALDSYEQGRGLTREQARALIESALRP